MIPVTIPTLDVNSTTCCIVAWHAAHRSWVHAEQRLLDVETSKATFEIASPGDGFLFCSFAQGERISVTDPVAFLFHDLDSLAAFERQEAAKKDVEKKALKPYRATRKAEALAKKFNVNLENLDRGSLITEKEVERFLHAMKHTGEERGADPLSSEAGTERILVIGGGLGATQVLDILKGEPARKAVAILDDNASLWGKNYFGVPVIGGIGRMESLYKNKMFDSAIIAISTSVPARTKFRLLCQSLNIPMANAIDGTSRISIDVTIGTGNVICAFCHFGVGTVVGDNNFFSAYNSIDHHCTVGSDSSTGPGCMVSGIVTLGSRLRFGTGIFVEPYLEIGDDVQIASGAIILKSIPPRHTVKTKVITTTILPLREET
jgi:acetyltransferase-like isoleucine patch superfamily enzyme